MAEFTEAPASNTFKVKSPAGFEHMFTMRDESVKELLTKIDTVEKALTDKGWTPLAQGNGFNRPTVPTKPCPTHNVDMKEKISKTGEKFYSHSRGTYPSLEYCNGTGFPNERKAEVPERQVDEY